MSTIQYAENNSFFSCYDTSDLLFVWVENGIKFIWACSENESKPLKPAMSINNQLVFGKLSLILQTTLQIFGIDQISCNLVMHRAGGTQRLPRLVGKAVAKDIIFTGRKINGIEALSMGMLIGQLTHFFLKLVTRLWSTKI